MDASFRLDNRKRKQNQKEKAKSAVGSGVRLALAVVFHDVAEQLAAGRRRGDGDELWKTYNYADSSLQADDTFSQVFIYGRNERMANRLLELAQPGKKRGPFFLVTGALHLVGDKSIQSYLSKAGFKIERL